MARYLIVANQTAESEEVRAQARALAQRDPEAEFAVLVPATPVTSLLVKEEGDTAAVSQRRADSARQRLADDGLRVVEARVGDPDPYTAVADELARLPDYAGIVIATLPTGVSRWRNIELGEMDIVNRLQQLAPEREILHVVAKSPVPGAKLGIPGMR